jgi:BMFP domain-containing protein YqiC|nr:MAG TPA: hypothetical protein [Caudoviricetes sp.]
MYLVPKGNAPTREELDALAKRVAELEKLVAELQAKRRQKKEIPNG